MRLRPYSTTARKLDCRPRNVLSNDAPIGYVATVMRHKSITFRCSAPQVERMVDVLRDHGQNRSACLSDALDEFLRFTDDRDVERLDLFALVDKVDAMGGPQFSDQA